MKKIFSISTMILTLVVCQMVDAATVGAPQEIWRDGHITATVTNSAHQSLHTTEIKREIHWVERVPYTTYRREVRDVLEIGICYEVVCTGGSGKSPLWTAYFSAPKHLKPTRLAEAIQGIGKVSAEKLVDAGYFNSKPKSWSDFALEIQKAASNGVIQKSVATKVLQEYRQENIQRLGYQANNCHTRQYTCERWVEREEMVPVTEFRNEDRSEVREVIGKKVLVEIVGADLLPSETELLRFSINRLNEIQLLSQNLKNIYRFTVGYEADTIIIRGQQISRNQAALSMQDLVQKSSIEIVNGQAALSLRLDPKAIPSQNEAGASLTIEYQVRTCNYGWTGYCGLFDRWVLSDLKIAEISSETSLISLPAQSGQRVQVSYRLKRTPSRYYHGFTTQDLQTNIVNIK